MANIFEKVFETINIYKSIVICKDMVDAINVHQALYDMDYAVTTELNDEVNRMLVIDVESFCHLHDDDLEWENYDVVFVADAAREFLSRLSLNLDNVKLIVFFDRSFQ